MKIFNVKGDMFDAGKDYPTQDIEFNSTPALDLANAKVTREVIDLRIKYGNGMMVIPDIIALCAWLIQSRSQGASGASREA